MSCPQYRSRLQPVVKAHRSNPVARGVARDAVVVALALEAVRASVSAGNVQLVVHRPRCAGGTSTLAVTGNDLSELDHDFPLAPLLACSMFNLRVSQSTRVCSVSCASVHMDGLPRRRALIRAPLTTLPSVCCQFIASMVKDSEDVSDIADNG